MRTLTLAACWLLCGAGCVRSDPPPVQFVPQLQFVPVPTELTEPLQCYQRADGTVREYIRQAEHNTAACEKANADRAATATLKAPEKDPSQ